MFLIAATNIKKSKKDNQKIDNPKIYLIR